MMIDRQSTGSASPTSLAHNRSGEEMEMNAQISNPILGECSLTTEHAASSYGIPVLIDAIGNAYGPADTVAPADELSWIHTLYGFADGPITGRMLVEKYGLAEWASIEPASNAAMRIELSRKFLGL